MRKLSDKFLNDLKNPDGLLHPILKRVKLDDTLMLAIRGGYINIYYRGGSILKVEEKGNGSYTASFAKEYGKSAMGIPDLPEDINKQDEAAKWVGAFPSLKELMDLYFCKHRKPEREFQQLVARENNYSTISNESEYFVSDIEFADSSLKARFDILAIRWLASDRKNGSNCRVALVEMKYGDGALDGDAGLLKHLKNIEEMISNKYKYKSLFEMMELQFNQLNELGLLKYKKCSNVTKVKLPAEDKPEVIIILANHNPRSKKLSSILKSLNKYGESEHFDLKIFVSSFAGYGLHARCMLTLAEFRKLLEKGEVDQDGSFGG